MLRNETSPCAPSARGDASREYELRGYTLLFLSLGSDGHYWNFKHVSAEEVRKVINYGKSLHSVDKMIQGMGRPEIDRFYDWQIKEGENYKKIAPIIAVVLYISHSEMNTVSVFV
jgi:hypothetical protein